MSENNKFEENRIHLKEMTDEQLKNYFWELTEKIVDPLINLAKNHTTPSIERSVLLRMGFNSIQSQELVKKCIENELIQKGAGHVVYKYAKNNMLETVEAGMQLIETKDWSLVKALFNK